MKRGDLHLVTGNLPRESERLAPAVAAEIDFHALAYRARYWFAMLRFILWAPFRFVTAAARIAVATGRGFFVSIFLLFLGTVGLTLIVFVSYGILRVILNPLFHR